MKKLFLIFCVCICNVFVFGQNKILPIEKSININLIKIGNSTMGYYFVKDGNAMEICNYQTEVFTKGDQLFFNSKLIFLKSDKQWKEQIVLDKNTLKPISRKSERETRNFDIKYANINKGDYFDIATYPLVLCALPLNIGYKATIPVIDYDSPNKDKIQNVNITDVKSNIYNSELTGEHQVWKVSVNEESTGNIYDYFIERQNQLSYFRWTLSGAFFILTLINGWYKCIEKVDISLYFIFLPLVIGIFLLILHYKTAKEYKEKIKLLIDLKKSKFGKN